MPGIGWISCGGRRERRASSKEVGEEVRKARYVLSSYWQGSMTGLAWPSISGNWRRKRVCRRRRPASGDEGIQRKGGSKPTLSPVPCPKAYPAEERQALEIALLYPEKRDRWAELLGSLRYLRYPHLRRAFSLFFRVWTRTRGGTSAVLVPGGDEDVRNLCTGIWAKERSELDNAEAAFTDCVRRIRDRRERLAKQELRRKYKRRNGEGIREPS